MPSVANFSLTFINAFQVVGTARWLLANMSGEYQTKDLTLTPSGVPYSVPFTVA